MQSVRALRLDNRYHLESNTMDKIQELKQKLAQAEATAAAAAEAAQLAAAKALVGKCFACPQQVRVTAGWWAVRFTSAEPDKWDPEKIQMTEEFVGCHHTGRRDATLARRISTSPYNPNSTTVLWGQPVDPGVFDRMWKLSLQVVKAYTAETAKDVPGAFMEVPDNEVDYGKADVLVCLDVPYIQVEAGDLNYLPITFQLKGDRYLLTPKSRTMGMDRIAQERSDLMRGSHLFEACDMKYVSGQQARFDRLTKQLKEL